MDLYRKAEISVHNCRTVFAEGEHICDIISIDDVYVIHCNRFSYTPTFDNLMDAIEYIKKVFKLDWNGDYSEIL